MDRSDLLKDIKHEERQGIAVIHSATYISVAKTAYQILNIYSDFKTALFLSGGKTPKNLYEEISKEGLSIGAALMVDERYGERLHKRSNELLMQETRLASRIEKQNIRFYNVLEDKSIEDTTKDYDETLRFLFNYFPKTAAVLGIGEDGHTAGIPSNPEIVKRIMEDQSSLVTFYDDGEKYGERITMTFLALQKLDLILILVTGEEKRKTLREIFKEGEITDMPARFFKKPGIAEKTILITDQMI